MAVMVVITLAVETTVTGAASTVTVVGTAAIDVVVDRVWRGGAIGVKVIIGGGVRTGAAGATGAGVGVIGVSGSESVSSSACIFRFGVGTFPTATARGLGIKSSRDSSPESSDSSSNSSSRYRNRGGMVIPFGRMARLHAGL